MNDQPIMIYRSRKMPYFFLLGIAAVIISLFAGHQIKDLYRESPVFTMVAGSLLLLAFFYLLARLIHQPPAITLTIEGIELQGHGLFSWEMIESFSTIYYEYNDNSDKEQLTLHLKDGTHIQYSISHLEKAREEIVQLMLRTSANEEVFYEGHSMQ
jgi:hypothetical protein